MKTKPVLTIGDCDRIYSACRAEAEKNKWNVTAAIVDDGGHVLLLKRMDGAAPVTAEIAELKSRHGERRVRRRRGRLGLQWHEDEQECNAGIAVLK